MKKILLTGGLGFFCTRFTQKYQHTFQILSTDKDDLDITNESSVTETFKMFKPDYVIHAAAIAVTDFCNDHPELAYKINVQGALNVAKACKVVGAKMVFISTEQVFNGNLEPGPYTEETTPIPDTIYGQNKLEAERLLQNLIDDLWILRFTWLFGLPERDCNINPNILWNTLNLALEGKKTKITAHEYRGLTYVHEIIDQFHKIFTLPYGLYHIGSHNNDNRYDISEYILSSLGLNDRIHDLIEKDEAKFKEHPRDVRLDTDKIRSYGFDFSDTKVAIDKCIQEFHFNMR
ncbi:MAG: NAD(P)-dependent oxidoreductase [Firmicutes bacterium HGW-Firmicutes-3]|jgi:dTDP-4-dehydrorhamnose reductase|nr:MAG: NAD(P)-dependent oxidoreductase [Firmicutes bacterium HGW-Firmicutes-3]